jgi:hypothetical protein
MKHILALGLFALFVAAGCGDEKKGATAPDCTATGTACADGADACCTGFCDELSGQCARVPGTCVAADGDCSVGPDCCSLSCIDFKCSGDQCVSDNESCDQDGECCSGVCTDNACAPLNASCKTAGNVCATNAECCAGLCNDPDGDGTSTCNNAPSFCTIAGDACVTDGECCGGLCSKADGAALGLCQLVPSSGATGCESLGEVCGNGADYDPATQELPTCGGECCSRACFPYGPTGVLICQPPSGCRPTGELCYEDSDCCGGPGQPDHSQANVMCRKEPGYNVGRCDNGNMCAPAGAICRLQDVQCNATATCCAGNAIQDGVCQQDALGIPRCGISQCAPNDPTCGENCDPATKVGMTCASSADCCGNPCTALPGTEAFVCGAACQMTGSTCTTNTDCCSGLPCVIPAGSTQGTCGNNQGCADYGQACDANNLCCNDLPCSNGICQGIIL